MTTKRDEYSLGYEMGKADGESDAFAKIASLTVQSAHKTLSVATLPPTQAEKDALRLASILSIVSSVPYAIYQAFVLSKLWQWFVLPNFNTAPRLGIVSSMGIILMVGLILVSLMLIIVSYDEKPIQKKINEAYGRLIAWPIYISIVFLMGFIYSLFM